MSKRVIHDKLVRDFIPDKLEKKGIKVVHSRLLDFPKRDFESRKKLVEESNEVFRAGTREKLIEELGDVADTFDLLLKLNGVTPQELADARAKKKAENGGFEEFRFLHSTEEP